MGKLTDKVARGVFWVLLEKCGVQGVQFVVTMILARLLTPDDYGTVALLSVFIAISNVLVDSGFGKALVQRKNATQTDFNTVFYISLAVSCAAYAALFFGAPLVARFYGLSVLVPMLRVLAVTVFLNALNGVQNAELNRKMLFRLSFRVSWTSAVVSAVTGVGLALGGFGAWALVWSRIAGALAGAVMRQVVIAWRPTRTFSWASARALFSFGWKSAVSSVVNDIYQDIYSLIIGKLYSRADLAFLNKGMRLPALLGGLTNGSLTRVSFPAFSSMQNDIRRMRHAMLRLIRVSMFFVVPSMVLLAFSADSIVLILFGEKWLPAVPYLRLTCLIRVLTPVRTINSQVTEAFGRSDIQLKLNVLMKVLCLMNIVFFLPRGIVEFLTVDAVFLNGIGLVVFLWPNRRLIGCSFVDQLANLLPCLVAGGGMGATLFALDGISWGGAGFRLLALGAAGAVAYLGLSLLVNRPTCSDVLSRLSKRRQP